MVLMVFQLNRPIPKGLWVFLAGRNDPGKSPIFSPPVIIRIESTRQSPPRVYVNSKPVAWRDLGSALTEELKVRSEWVVYVEGDRDLQWDDIVNAVDTIRGVHARAVLLGSK
jgi:biopolymer transport protein ExbD